MSSSNAHRCCRRLPCPTFRPGTWSLPSGTRDPPPPATSPPPSRPRVGACAVPAGPQRAAPGQTKKDPQERRSGQSEGRNAEPCLFCHLTCMPAIPHPAEVWGDHPDDEVLRQLYRCFGGIPIGGPGAPRKEPHPHGRHNSIPWTTWRGRSPIRDQNACALWSDYITSKVWARRGWWSLGLTTLYSSK